jgi:hypothetical protein
LKLKLEQNQIDNVRLIEDMPEKALLDEGFADCVFFGAVISSLYNPFKALENAYIWLKDSGRVIILD